MVSRPHYSYRPGRPSHLTDILSRDARVRAPLFFRYIKFRFCFLSPAVSVTEECRSMQPAMDGLHICVKKGRPTSRLFALTDKPLIEFLVISFEKIRRRRRLGCYSINAKVDLTLRRRKVVVNEVMRNRKEMVTSAKWDWMELQIQLED